MAKEIYIDENGNENLVSGTINYGSLLPMSPSDPDFVADRITALEIGKVDKTSFTSITSISSANANVTVNQGGYIKCGKVVIVTAKITLSSNLNISTKILTGLPTDMTDGTGVLISGMSGTFSARMSSGEFYLNQNLSSGEYWVNGCYFTNQ